MLKDSDGKVRWTTIAVLIFVALFLWGLSNDSDAGELRVALGGGVLNSEGQVTQELRYVTDDLNWYASVTRIGNGDFFKETFRYDAIEHPVLGHQAREWVPFDTLTRWSAGYRVNWRRGTNWSPYMGLGMAYFDKKPDPYISDNVAFDMRLGLRMYEIVELEFTHNSTAGRTTRNKGLDQVALSAVFKF